MTKLTFFTSTTLDEAFIFTMGASVKTGSNPIGFFGTGLKYAIAVTLRLGGSIKIETRNHKYEFRTYGSELRGKTIHMISCDRTDINGVLEQLRCPMTADYGKTWKPWMVMRELYSNTIDEGGEVREGDWDGRSITLEALKPQMPTEYTRIVVEHPEIYDAWIMRDKYILNKQRNPIYSCDELDIYSGGCDTFFYRGISVAVSPIHACYTYNVKVAIYGLTEDRTMSNESLKTQLSYALHKSKDEGIARSILTAACTPETFEAGIFFASYDIKYECSVEYAREAVAAVKKHITNAPQGLKAQVYEYQWQQDAESIYKRTKLTDEEQAKADECFRILANAGMTFEKWKLYWSTDMTAMATTSLAQNVIVMNPDLTLHKPDWKRETCKTLIEEWVHLRYHAPDFTREMQEGYNQTIWELIGDK